MSSRHRAREQALQILYLIDMSAKPATEALNLFRSNFEHNEDDFHFVQSIVEGVTQNTGEIDELILKHSKNWKLGRMARIDRSILRLAVFELRYCPETPGAVVLDEAVELGKAFGDTNTAPFINGILDPLAREVRGRV